MQPLVIGLEHVGLHHVGLVGGKNASLGEMIANLSKLGIAIPSGFATTTTAFNQFLDQNKLHERILIALKDCNTDDINMLMQTSANIRQWILATPFTADFIAAVKQAYSALTDNNNNMALAVRSSAILEDTAETATAGQQETFLNIRGIDNVLDAIKQVYASLFSARALASHQHKAITSLNDIAISVAVQHMVRSETGTSGIIFTLDTESGFRDVVLINASYGLGEMMAQGAVSPDEYYISKAGIKAGKHAIVRRNLGSKHQKMIYGDAGTTDASTTIIEVDKAERMMFCLTDEDLVTLTKQALIIEDHYKQPMDIEWAKDGDNGKIYIVQARPETVKSKQNLGTMERYLLKQKGTVLCEGRSIGQRIGSGKVRLVNSFKALERVQPGDIIVSDMTDPDWEPAMHRASAVITNRGGRTCHAAIIAREIGLPAVVGCGNATEVLIEGQPVTVSCAEGDTGFVYEGALDFEVQKNSLASMPTLPLKIMMNVGNPDRAFDFAQTPNQGVGLARLEFIINRMIGVHPKALLNFESLPRETKNAVLARTAGYASPVDFYVEKLVEGIATLATAFSGKSIIVRMSDFKSNEYANLIGGKLYEPAEENPMLGFRGASRYISESFRDCFELECRAIKKVREQMGLNTVEILIPFVRTVAEAARVIELLADNGLKSGENGLRIYMMCELPTNALLADQFLKHFDGFLIGTNDLTQLTLGIDRDSGIVSHLFDERDEAVKTLMSMAISACRKSGKYIGISGQGPSKHPDFAHWIMQQGVDSLSLNPDAVLDIWFYLAQKLQEQ